MTNQTVNKYNLRTPMFYNMIRLNVKVPEDLDLVALCNFTLNMVVLFCSHLDTPFLAQIPMNHLGQLVMSSFVLHSLTI